MLFASLAVPRCFPSLQSYRNMITNRDEVIDKAFSVFVKMNYEKASISTLAQACGLKKTGITYYFPRKQDLFVAVVDKFVLQLHQPAAKFGEPAATLEAFIGQYVKGVEQSMNRIVTLVDNGNNPYDCSPNFYYIHFLSQVRMYYPGIRPLIAEMYGQDFQLWQRVIRQAMDRGEIKADTDVDNAAGLFHHLFVGLSFEHSFLQGLDLEVLERKFRYIYSLLKA